MANAFVINRSNRGDAAPPSEDDELLGYNVLVDDEEVWVVTPHGRYASVGESVRDAINEAYPDAKNIKLLGSSTYRRDPSSDYGWIHVDPIRKTVDRHTLNLSGHVPATITVNDVQYKLVPIE